MAQFYGNFTSLSSEQASGWFLFEGKILLEGTHLSSHQPKLKKVPQCIVSAHI